MADKPMAPALQLLDQTYEALLSGAFATLPELAQRLEQQLQGTAQDLTEAELRLVRQKADRNAVVLLAAQRGVRSARRRVAEIRTAAAGLVTYDRSGKRAEVSESRALAQRL